LAALLSDAVARNGNPDDEFYGEPTQYADYRGSGGQAYSEPTQYSDYGAGGQAYSEYPQQPGYGTAGNPTGQAPAPEPPEPWYRKPAGLVALGALGVIVAALVVYAIVHLLGSSKDTTPTGTTTVTTSAPATSEAPANTSAEPAPPPGFTQTVTESPTTTAPPETTTEAPTTTSEAPTTTPSPEVSTSTVTETVTQSRPRPTWPTLFPRPTAGEGGQ